MFGRNMIVKGTAPPYRQTPESLHSFQYVQRGLKDVRNENCQTTSVELKKSKEKRPNKKNSKDDMRRMYFKIVQPGYTIAKRNSGIDVTLNMDELWEGATKESKKSLLNQDERDLKIKKLIQEISDLKASISEERISNRTQFQQFVENTKIDVEVMIQEHRDHIKTIEEDHELELENLKAMYEAKINDEKEEANIAATQMQREIDAVRGTLQSCTEDVTVELEKQWLDRKEKLNVEHQIKAEQLLKEQRLKLKSERIAMINDIKEKQLRELENVRERHSREMNNLREEFDAFAADAENFRIAALEAERLKEELTDLQDVHNETKNKLRKTKNELADAKVQLHGYELRFAEKVAEVEERYSMKIQGLMLNNTDIRRNYMRKCAELLDVQNTIDDSPKERKSSNTKTTMKTIILARAKADVSLVTAEQKTIPMKGSQGSGKRPRSAPVLKPEVFEDGNLFLTLSELRQYRPNSSLA
ncbi:centrosomal protein of 112 kDa-like isoform X2 [Dendronephthya gigantea]|uniref:centrosomal protein of 112 kDa-like isoform X2 n=1 Tax=Dendronephthya gigantea TaxID=151771 RepID=UPI00106ACA06|nr:centrosomal protein of 112 kDa-like isoform X2 [Dendronephthya gigantea]